MELFSLLAKLTLDSSDFEKNLSNAQKDADNFEMPETPELELDTDDFKSGVSEAEVTGQGFGTTMEGVFSGIKNALTVTGIVGLVMTVVNGLKEAVDMTVQTADGIDKGSARLNISKKKYQEWDHALRQSGASITDLQKGVVNFNKYVASFQPGAVIDEADEAIVGAGGDMAQAFARLRINVKDANGDLKTTEQLIEESLIALADFNGTDEERGVLVTQLFGRGGMSLNALLDSGAKGVKELLAEANNLGLVMSDEEIAQAVAYGDSVANLKAEIDAVKQAFVTDLIPRLKEAVDFLTELTAFFNPRNKGTILKEAFAEIDAKTITSNRKLNEMQTTAQNLIDKLAEMGDYWTLDEHGQKTWNELAQEFIDRYPEFAEYIDLENKKINENTDTIKANIREWAKRERQKLLDQALDEKKLAIARLEAQALDKEVQAEIKEAEVTGKRATAIEEMNDAINASVEELEKQAAANEEYGMTYEDQNALDLAAYLRKKAEERKKLLLDDNATLEQFQESQLALLGTMDEFGDTERYNKVLAIGSAWTTAEAGAANLRKEAEELYAQSDEATKNLERYQEQLSKKLKLTGDDLEANTENANEYALALTGIPTDVYTTVHQFFDEDGFPRAIGDRYIPYDNFPALLHRGEKVLTATEARKGANDGIDYTRLEDSIIASIREGMADASVTAVVTDRQVAKGSNRYNGNEMDSRRFRP